MFCYFVEDLFVLVLNTFVVKVILVSFIQRQIYEQLFVSNYRFRVGKFIFFRWLVVDEFYVFGREFVMQYIERIEELFVVFQLIVKFIQRNNFIFKVQVVELILDGFLVFLDFIKILGRDIQNEYIVLFY